MTRRELLVLLDLLVLLLELELCESGEDKPENGTLFLSKTAVSLILAASQLHLSELLRAIQLSYEGPEMHERKNI